ncbi:MAG: aminotransferase class III-fold pyridoxal phosphate-dependent enzyme [Candidatus Diapherotrites archaeon]|nr:aminotransferase class III-fold pyridoxal phosphate-dependent enzyme [Candidatus Diapherotrites archaeon]MDZ4256399.1 aminotransferase class III-fold pyridoxal phosphate-dependent enzyme [archaeon]
MNARIRSALPGPLSKRILERLKKVNGGYNIDHPFVHSGKGRGSHFEDLDGNWFLDFGSQIATNPLGYNHPTMMRVLKTYAGRAPIKFGGQDFTVREHLDIIEELLRIVPKKLNAAFLINSGAEANENAIKIAVRKNPAAKVGVSFENGWHGRTTGALSLTNSRAVQVKHYFRVPARRLPFTEAAGDALEDMLRREFDASEIGFVIMECVQGEGGYYPAPQGMVKSIRKTTKTHGIPLIVDEVQAGMGRTGRWWAYQHYGVEPDIQTCAKALQVGATIANTQMFPPEGSAISSTWGGGHIIDMAMGAAIIREIKKKRLMGNVAKQGKTIQKGIEGMAGKFGVIQNPRGLGLMQAFDLPTVKMRNAFRDACFREGLIVLGCGVAGIRLAPALTVKNQDIQEGLSILERVAGRMRGD